MLIIFGMWWFWIALAIFVGLIVCEATESAGWATLTVIVGVLGLQFLGDVNIYGWVVSNPLSLMKWCGLYFVAGTVWCTTKWWMYALDCREKYREKREDFFKRYELTDTIPHSLKEKWESCLDEPWNKYEYPPKISSHKARVIRWLAYWPPSVIWTLINDVVERIAKSIYNMISSFLQSISDRVFKGEKVAFDPPTKEDNDKSNFGRR